MERFKFLVVALHLFVSCYCYAQEYQNITIEDGLPSNNVYKITQDAQGFIWFITDKGMVKFDGEKMKVFSTKEGLPANDIWNIRVTPDGKVWYFSKSTALGYIYNDEVFSFPSENKEEVLIPNIIYQAGNEIGFGNQGITRIIGGKWTAGDEYYDIKKDTKVLLIGKNNNYKFALNEDKGVVIVSDCLRNNQWNFFWNKLRSGQMYLHGQINEDAYLTVDPLGASVLDLRNKKVWRLTVNEIFNEASSRYTRITNTLGSLQLSNDYGVATLDSDFRVTSVYFMPKELDSHFSFIDRDGNIWAASLKNGVYFLPHTTQIKTLFPNQKVKGISKNNDVIYISIEGKGAYEMNTQALIPKLVTASQEYLYGVFSNEHTGYNYLTTRADIYKWKKGQERIRIDPSNVSATNFTARQIITVGEYGYGNSLMHLNKINLNDFSIEETVDFLGIFALLGRDNDLLVGSNSGLYSINKELDINSKKSLLDVPVTSLILMKNKDVIIGSDGQGVYLLRDGIISKIEMDEEYIVEDIAQDNNGSIYFATNEGVIVVENNKGAYHFSRKILRSDGLRSNKVNSVFVSDFSLFAGSDNGLAVLDLSLLKTQVDKPRVYLDNIRIGEERIKSDTIVRKFNTNNTVSASFGILDFKDQSSIKRAYQLLPTSMEWNAIETNQINIGNLEPDNYKLSYKITDHKGVSSSKVITLNITPLWFQTNLYKVFVLMSVLLLTTLLSYGLLRYFQRQKTLKLIRENEIAQTELRALRSQMNPHFVFNSLGAIQYYINNNENEVSERYLVKFSKLIRRFFQLSGEHEIVLSEEIKLLEGYLEIEKLRFKDKLNFHIEVDKDLDIEQFSIPTMLLQPVVENAVNHGVFNKDDHGKIEVTFIKESQREIHVTIVDDGVGYQATKTTSKKKKSSNVLAERLHFLNQSREWLITHTITQAFPEKFYPGTKVIFIIKKLK